MIKQIACALCLLCLGGCAPMIVAPIIEPPGATFKGIGSLIANEGSPATVIWLHGMCSHFDDWADARAGSIRDALGGTLTDGENVVIGDTRFHLRRYELTGPQYRASLNFVVWSTPSIERKRERLCFDTEYERVEGSPHLKKVCTNRDQNLYFPHKRAELNGALKAVLMNDCLADAVFYAGANGASVREAMRQALCVALSEGDRGNADCAKPIDQRDIVLVSESLGSKVLFDAVVCADAAAVGAAQLRARQDQMQALALALSRVTHLFLLANQIPILELANGAGVCPDQQDVALFSEAPKKTSPSSLAAFLRAIETAGRQTNRPTDLDFGRRVIVAFTDPNDLLSYRLTKTQVPDEASNRLINVYDSNAGTLLGLIERPDEAHLGYRTNRDVVKLLICGKPSEGAFALCR